MQLSTSLTTRVSTKLDFFSFVSVLSLWLLERTVMEKEATIFLNTNRNLKSHRFMQGILDSPQQQRSNTRMSKGYTMLYV